MFCRYFAVAGWYKLESIQSAWISQVDEVSCETERPLSQSPYHFLGQQILPRYLKLGPKVSIYFLKYQLKVNKVQRSLPFLSTLI